MGANQDGSKQFYKCPDCIENYFWMDSTATEPGFCAHCREFIDHCHTCNDKKSDCLQCEPGYVRSPDGRSCDKPIENCLDRVGEHNRWGDKWACTHCEIGWYPNGDGECTECEIADCDDCSDETTCIDCGSKLISVDGKSCQDEFSGCNCGPECYTIVDGAWACPQCETNTETFNVYASPRVCEACTSAVPDCSTCDSQGLCDECKDGWEISPNARNCTKFIDDCEDVYNSNNVAIRSRKVADANGFWRCEECDAGKYWINGTCGHDCSDLFDDDNMVTSADKEGCVPYIPHCSFEPIATQPGNLPIATTWVYEEEIEGTIQLVEKHNYHCHDGCLPGFFWDDNMCAPCATLGCSKCDWNGCLECEDELFLDADSLHCIAPFEGCTVPAKIQPMGLSIENGRYTCDECHQGWFWDPTKRSCQPCDHSMPGCEVCSSATHCQECEGGRVPNGPTCNPESIPNCKHVNPADHLVCEECHVGSVLSDDKARCVDCSQLGAGCIECDLSLTQVLPEMCTECAESLELHWGRCKMPNCYKWHMTMSGAGPHA